MQVVQDLLARDPVVAEHAGGIQQGGSSQTGQGATGRRLVCDLVQVEAKGLRGPSHQMHEHPPIWQDCTAANVDMDRAAKRQGMAAHCPIDVAELLLGMCR